MNGPYQFNLKDAEDFARSRGIPYFSRGKELFFKRCPYCEGTTKDQKTFSINATTGTFHCFRSKCGASGNMITLARDFNFSLGQNADEYYQPRRKYNTFTLKKEPVAGEIAKAYLEERGISAATVERYKITEYDGNIAFLFFDEKGHVQTIKYRNPHPKEGQSKEWFVPNCKPILYGMQQCNPDNKTLIVTEGQIDSLSVAEAGLENAVSVPGGVNSFTWVPYCWDWMQRFEKIIVFGDHEKGKVTLYTDFLQRWKNKVWCVREEDYLDCKDANDILRKYGSDQIRKCVENAAQPPISKVIDLADVEDVDVSKMEKLRTGLWKIDDVLDGGLPFGQVILITGKAGEGKSTLANQLILSAVNAGYKSMVYSGELPNYLLKSWMTFQAAGPSWVFETEKRWKDKEHAEYYVDPEVKTKISNWFRGNLYAYDSRIMEDEDEEQVKLTGLIEDVVVRLGVSVILLDNLMTALDLDADTGNLDKYERQSAFVKKLTRIAQRHNVLILLVAHKKKGIDGSNDAVSGSADIVNLASIVISYEKLVIKADDAEKERKKKMRVLRITKNRVYGNLLEDGQLMEFDEATKRIYEAGNNGERRRIYNWEDKWFKATQMSIEDMPWEQE